MIAHTRNPESDRETRNREQTYSVKLGVAGSGATVYVGDLPDCLEHNRLRIDGQSRVWRSDGVAMTMPKVRGKMAERLAEFHEAEAAFMETAGPLDVPSGRGLAAVVNRGFSRRRGRRVA